MFKGTDESMIEDALEEDLKARADKLIAVLNEAATEMASEMPTELIAQYVLHYFVGRNSTASPTPHKFLLEAIGREAAYRMRAGEVNDDRDT